MKTYDTLTFLWLNGELFVVVFVFVYLYWLKRVYLQETPANPL